MMTKSQLQQMIYSEKAVGDAIAMRENFPDLRPPTGYGFRPDGVGRIQVTEKDPRQYGAVHVHGYLSRAWARARS